MNYLPSRVVRDIVLTDFANKIVRSFCFVCLFFVCFSVLSFSIFIVLPLL